MRLVLTVEITRSNAKQNNSNEFIKHTHTNTKRLITPISSRICVLIQSYSLLYYGKDVYEGRIVLLILRDGVSEILPRLLQQKIYFM